MKKLLLGLLLMSGSVWAGTLPKGVEAVDSPGDEECLTYESSSARFEWQSCANTPFVADITLENSEFIDNGTDGTINFGRNDSGTVTIGSLDDDTTAAMTLNPGGVTTLTLGGSTDTVSVAATSGVTLSNSESISNGTNGTVTVGRNDSGTVTVTAADDDATAALTVLPGGAAAMTLGGASTTSLTVTTDGTGTAEVALPTGSIATAEILDATILPADENYPGRVTFTVCGDATTVNNNTVYYGPDMTVVSSATVGLNRKCDTTAVGNVTEATADTPAFTAKAFIVLGMECNHPDSNATLTFTARSAEAGLTPALVVTTTDNQTQGMTSAPSTTAIASGATFAVAVASTSDIGTVPFVCTVNAAY